MGSQGKLIQRGFETREVTIESGQPNSGVIDLGGGSQGSFQLPATFTGSDVLVQYSVDGTTFTDVPAITNESNPQSVTTNGTYYFPIKTFNARYARLVSSDNEGANRDIDIFLRG